MQQSFFESSSDSPQSDAQENEPLAARMRPTELDEVLGQEHLLGAGRVLRRTIESGRIGSLVLWGPPGTGKTSLAHVIARRVKRPVATLSAVSSGIGELRKVVDEAQRRRPSGVVLILDEVHRWNKAQQDSLLPVIESGLVTLIGLTSENPYFDLVPALRSRLRILHLEPLSTDQLRSVLNRALADPDHGLGNWQLEIEDSALDALVQTSGGDARQALNGLEAAALLVRQSGDRSRITVETVREALQQRNVRHDRAGDDHYQTISAFIKSLRGSDPDAAIFWLAVLLKGGEEPRFIARRMVISAAEDIGMADPQALVQAEAVARAVEHVGMPEAQLILASGTVYLATAPKSNSAAKALWSAQQSIENGISIEVPLQLRNASFEGAKGLGYGVDYQYSHDFAENDPQRYAQRYLPDGVDLTLYEPRLEGREIEIGERLREKRRLRSEGRAKREEGDT